MHVFDELSLDVVLGELDTAPDFIDYLRAREALIRGRGQLIAAGEEEILAYYLRYRYKTPERAFAGLAGDQMVVLDEGHWNTFRVNPQYIAKKAADKISYVWDAIIEMTSRGAMDGRLVHGAGEPMSRHEAVLRSLARRTRFERRILSAALCEAVQIAGKGRKQVARMELPQDGRTTAHVFLAVPQKPFMTDSRYREYRAKLLLAYCRIVGLRNRQYVEIVGIATEEDRVGPRSHDVALWNNDRWTPSEIAEVEALQRTLKIADTARLPAQRRRPLEYPEPRALAGSRQTRPGRNDPCPCGSGRKYKKCCGVRDG